MLDYHTYATTSSTSSFLAPIPTIRRNRRRPAYGNTMRRVVGNGIKGDRFRDALGEFIELALSRAGDSDNSAMHPFAPVDPDMLVMGLNSDLFRPLQDDGVSPCDEQLVDEKRLNDMMASLDDDMFGMGTEMNVQPYDGQFVGLSAEEDDLFNGRYDMMEFLHADMFGAGAAINVRPYNGQLVDVKAEIKLEPYDGQLDSDSLESLAEDAELMNDMDVKAEIKPQPYDGQLVDVKAEIKLQPYDGQLVDVKAEIKLQPYDGQLVDVKAEIKPQPYDGQLDSDILESLAKGRRHHRPGQEAMGNALLK
ncbi:hypothetical protein GUITHDRAFT_119040 [Guillardia theta CCMP2712]|uniref:Uncharacterized protein n=1 Tax=Guillardia theta (strain CCMP2712) TaxID=905079 RepID=L1IG24_GUITC|nr:hypothetical protein GUITHDRAFT_119040 [Guillardia theta CCMP2712]EKX34854.1 hypothetical protein GUITHDRAFT_119040 [Guillardia theta CCMP2712]|eukprot:XP_005821834.1 hypothetical protein GUITHDRAFT_119040 [Guillardia theta CCMP2712]